MLEENHLKKNIAIIMGGYSSEYKISLQSGEVVYKHLDNDKYLGYRIHIFKDRWVYVDEKGIEFLIDKNDFSVETDSGKITFDCVFNAIHGTPGEDGYIQGYLDLLGLPHTSCDMYQAALTFNKRDCLSVLKAYGIKTAKSIYLSQGDNIDTQHIVKTLGLPCIVKPNRSGSSFGISLVKNEDELIQAIETAYKEDPQILIESYLEGREVSVGVITYKGEAKVLPVTEIISENEFFDYQAKYEGASQEVTPADMEEKAIKKVQDLALQVYTTLGMKGFSRSEYIFHKGMPHLLEMNTIPGLTEASILPQQAAAAGITLTELFGDAIESAMNTKAKKDA